MLSVAMRISHMAKKIKQQIKQSTIWEHQSKANHEIDWEGIKILDQETVYIKKTLKLRPSISDASIQPSIEMGVENFLRFSIISRHMTNSCDCAIQLKATILKNWRPLKTTILFIFQIIVIHFSTSDGYQRSICSLDQEQNLLHL